MRNVSRGGVSLRYPDELGFAFNPCLIVATGSGVTSMEVEMTGENGSVISDERDAFSGGCYADMREYVQSFFDNDVMSDIGYSSKAKTKTGQRVLFRVIAGGQTFDFSVYYIWGGMKPDGRDKFNAPRTLYAFIGYPFVFGVFVSASDTVNVNKNSAAYQSVGLSDIGMWNIPLEVSDESAEYLVYSNNDKMCLATFDETFDLTFRMLPFDEGNYLRIKVGCDVKDGIYLRWIDRHGFYCHYLFQRGDEQRKIENEGQFLRNNIVNSDMSYGYSGGLGRQMVMKRQEVVPVCASLVDGDTWDMLSDMVSSPILDMFTGYVSGSPRWVAVQCEPGTLVKSRMVLQDFECNVIMPEVPVQKL